MRRQVWIVAIGLLIFSVPLSAQFIKWGPDKTVQVVIERGPDFGGLMVKRVAFGQTSGPCSSELVDRMVLPSFQANHVDVIERQHLDQILAEHRLSQSGEVDSSTEVQLGKILGPSALILVKVYSCNPQQQSLFNDAKDFQGQVHRTFISQTRFTLEGAVEIVDLTTGQVLGSHNFQSKPQQQNTAENGQPEFPATDVVKDQAMNDAKIQINNMFFPGAEVKNMLFYDDKDCGLKDAYQLYERGDHDGSLKLLLSNLDVCKSGKKDKSLVRAYYDLGLEYCSQKQFDQAKQFFQQAMQSKGAEAVSGTASDCARAEAGVAAAKAYRQKFAQLPEPRPIETAKDMAPQSSPAITSSAQPKIDPGTAPKPSPEDRLKQLNKLFKDGLISQKEYEQKKAEILKDM